MGFASTPADKPRWEMTVKTYVGRVFLAAVTVAVGIAALVIAHGFPEVGGPGVIGPAYFPELLGFVLIGLGVLEGILAVLKRPSDPVEVPGMITMVVFAAVTAAFIYAAPWIGWYLATFVYVFVALLLLNARRLLLAALTAGVTTAVVYLVFDLVLHVSFPTGRLF